MKRILPVFLLIFLLSGCGGPKISDTPSDMEPNARTDVTMEIVEGSARPGQVTVVILNTGDAEIDSGN